MSKGADDGKEFLVMNLVVYLCRAQGAGVVANSIKFLLVGRVLLP